VGFKGAGVSVVTDEDVSGGEWLGSLCCGKPPDKLELPALVEDGPPKTRCAQAGTLKLHF
jgi:hypothetical protein